MFDNKKTLEIQCEKQYQKYFVKTFRFAEKSLDELPLTYKFIESSET